MPKSGEYDKSYIKKLENIGIILLEPFCGAKKHHKMKCLLCGKEWNATPISKIQNFKKHKHKGCPDCTKKTQQFRIRKNRKECLNKLKERFEILSDISDIEKVFKYGHKIKVKNKECKHIFESRTKNLVSRDVICPICNNDRKRKQFQQWNIDTQIEYRKTATEWNAYRHDVYISTRKTYSKHKTFINPQNLLRGKAGVPGAYHLDHIVPVRYCFENNIPVEVCAHPQNLQMLPWKKNIHSKHKIKKTIPPVFYPYISNKKRRTNFINEVTNEANEPYILHSKVLDPYPTTIYYQDANLCILFCTLDDFNESKTSKRYFVDMLDIANENNIRVLVIFEDEWNKTPDLVLSKILHYSGSSKALRRYARQCECRYVTSKEKSTFLNKHHIQGNDNSQKHIGAFYEDELIAVMTFSAPRVALGGNSKDTNTVELVRFATHINYHIVGIASKLLTFFERNEDYDNIYSFADKRWSVGNLYEKIGFKIAHHNPPDYFYIIDGERKHRWNYRKDKLKENLPNYDSNLTEYQNMQNAGYDRIWGCGTIKYIKNRS